MCARSRQGGTAGVEILSGGLEMPVLVDSAETCTSGLAREVYEGDLVCHVVRGSMGVLAQVVYCMSRAP